MAAHLNTEFVIVTRPVVPLENLALFNFLKNDQRTGLFQIFWLENHAAWVGPLAMGYFLKKKGGGLSYSNSAPPLFFKKNNPIFKVAPRPFFKKTKNLWAQRPTRLHFICPKYMLHGWSICP